jgi:hypothetical protein
MKSDLQRQKETMQDRLKKDTGLLKLGPRKQMHTDIVTEEALYELLPDLEKYYDLWLAYPDKLLELFLPTDTSFSLFPFQKLGLRANLRYKYVFQIATRGYSKSFIAVLSKMMKCILLPRTKETMVAEHKNQAARIGREKIQELIQLMPLLDKEIDRSKGSGTTMGDDFIRLRFKNGSELDLVGIGDGTRGIF